jgi:hypothetical protein
MLDFNHEWKNVSINYRKSFPISTSKIVHSAVPELFHADRQTDRHGEANGHIFAHSNCESA